MLTFIAFQKRDPARALIEFMHALRSSASYQGPSLGVLRGKPFKITHVSSFIEEPEAFALQEVHRHLEAFKKGKLEPRILNFEERKLIAMYPSHTVCGGISIHIIDLTRVTHACATLLQPPTPAQVWEYFENPEKLRAVQRVVKSPVSAHLTPLRDRMFPQFKTVVS